jgi:hypothetical protein
VPIARIGFALMRSCAFESAEVANDSNRSVLLFHYAHVHEWIAANDMVRVRHKGKLIVTHTMSARHTLHRRPAREHLEDRRVDWNLLWRFAKAAAILQPDAVLFMST